MNITSEIQTAVVVAGKFKEATMNAELARRAITNFSISCPAGIMDESEQKAIMDAAKVLDSIAHRTREHDALEYIKKLDPVTNLPNVE